MLKSGQYIVSSSLLITVTLESDQYVVSSRSLSTVTPDQYSTVCCFFLTTEYCKAGA